MSCWMAVTYRSPQQLLASWAHCDGELIFFLVSIMVCRMRFQLNSNPKPVQFRKRQSHVSLPHVVHHPHGADAW